MKFDWQHWALLGVGFVTVVGPTVASWLGASGFSGAAADVSHVVGFAALVLSLLKASPLPAGAKS